MRHNPDVLIIGSGIGGATLGRRLAKRGAHVMVLERGPFLPREPDNWSFDAVFKQKKYTAREVWLDRTDKPFRPAIYYFVGGCSKFYGCNTLRMSERDFDDVQHLDGVSPAWPIRYADLEPYYTEAERLYWVHGQARAHPTEPPRTAPYAYPPVVNDEPVEQLMSVLRRNGMRPFPQPVAIALPSAGHCIRCKTCDGYPCRVAAKGEAETCGVKPALATGRLELRVDTLARRLLLSPGGKRVDGVEVERDGEVETLSAPVVVVAGSAVNSAALLLRSACSAAPQGLASRSGVVGRNYMAHNNAALMSVGPRRNETVFQKTVVIHDLYFGGLCYSHPLGAIQLLGKLQGGMLTASNPFVPQFASAALARRSFQLVDHVRGSARPRGPRDDGWGPYPSVGDAEQHANSSPAGARGRSYAAARRAARHHHQADGI